MMMGQHDPMTVIDRFRSSIVEAATAECTTINIRDRALETSTDGAPRRLYDVHLMYRSSRGDYGGGSGYSGARNYDSRPARDEQRSYGNIRQERSRSRGDYRRTYRDRDREGYRSPESKSRSSSRTRSRSRSPQRRRNRSPYHGGPPSKEAIMEGIPLDITEADVTEQLRQGYNVDQVDDVRIIRDRQTKVSRGFGFLRFPSIEASKSFLERNYPFIYLYGKESAENDNQAAKVRIAFSRERHDAGRGEKDGEWTCKICTFVNFPTRTRCFKCQSPQLDMSAYAGPPIAKQQPTMNSGDSDVAPDGSPSQFLLLRGLEPTVTEDLLAKGVSKLYKPSRQPSPPAALSSKKGNAKVASTTGDANLGAREGSLRRILLDAQAAVTRFNSFDKFTISSKPVVVDYVHAGVFVPVFNPAEDPDKFCFSPLGSSATKLAYWDKEAYVHELVVSPGAKQAAAAIESQTKSVADLAAAAAEGEGLVPPGKEGEAKMKKRKAEAATATAKPKKTAPAHLQFWSNRHAELHGIRSDSSGEQRKGDEEAKNVSSGASAPDNSTPTETFANPTKKCCYLCSRQFKSEGEVNKHERLSQLHRDNVQKADLVMQARAKMSKAGLSTTSSREDTSEYRDRAKERRQAFGTSEKISLPLKKQASQPEGAEPPEGEQPAAPSKGASLLGKMGWSAGEGLGAQGTGRTESIATDMYVQGVGLGAQGGKIGDAIDEAERNTKGGYGDFLERTKDKAKERFEKMG
ncbi:MAG: hypothetical protein Q9216_005605 [Gyalolechia sp. 2 TL-2023]